ncbi:GGDEF domain-containing protein [Capsulimonas corticalis]|nr:GGDEF domain-containing protein [Capsulimonas corticalis]
MVVLEFQRNELEKANAELEALATTDGLTGLKNHQAFQECLSEEVQRALRHGQSLSLVLMDVDHFKHFNDTHGHPAGDVVLKTVALILREVARDTDLTARYGGEEFVTILPETDIEGASALAERLRASIERHYWPLHPVTASFGVAALKHTDICGADIIARADRALYQAKAAGRNRVVVDG